MAALTVYLSASPADAAFAARLRQAIVANGGKVVSSAPSPSGDASGEANSGALPARELKTLDDARAFVPVLSPSAAESAQLRAEAERYATQAGQQRDGQRKVVPVQLTPPSPESALPALQGYTPVTGPYGSTELDDQLIAETLRRLGLPVERNPFLVVLLIGALLALLLLACLGLQVFAPAGGLHFLVAARVPTATAQPTAVPTVAPTPTPTPVPNGLYGQYYRSRTYQCCLPLPDDLFGDLLFSQVDPQINIQSGFGKYPDPRLSGGAYAIRWMGQIVPRFSETYTLVTHSDDAVRVWINGKLIIDDWTTHYERVEQATIAMTANQPYDIRIDYYENDQSGAVMTLQWQSASQQLELVPASQMRAVHQ
jgi:hypothetical protein